LQNNIGAQRSGECVLNARVKGGIVSSRSVVLVPADLQSIADALRQIEAEYREMPGLSVTEAQAQRLWGLDKTTCRRALDALVERGVLRRTWHEAYVRAEMSSRLSAVSTSGDVSRRRR
jgi:hypothetical protein